MDLSLQFKHALYLQIFLQVFVVTALARLASASDRGANDTSHITTNQENRASAVPVQISRAPATEEPNKNIESPDAEKTPRDYRISGSHRISENNRAAAQGQMTELL